MSTTLGVLVGAAAGGVAGYYLLRNLDTLEHPSLLGVNNPQGSAYIPPERTSACTAFISAHAAEDTPPPAGYKDWLDYDAKNNPDCAFRQAQQAKADWMFVGVNLLPVVAGGVIGYFVARKT